MASSEPKSTFLYRAQTYWTGIPLWAIMLVTIYMLYQSIGPVKAMIFHGDWPLPKAGDIKTVKGKFIDGGGRRAPYRVLADNGEVIKLACIPESAGAECLIEMGYSSRLLPGKHASVEYFYVRNYTNPALTNIIVSAVIDGTVVLPRQQGLQALVKWKLIERKIDWIADIIYIAPASLAWFMLGSAWLAKLGPSRRGADGI